MKTHHYLSKVIFIFALVLTNCNKPDIPPQIHQINFRFSDSDGNNVLASIQDEDFLDSIAITSEQEENLINSFQILEIFGQKFLTIQSSNPSGDFLNNIQYLIKDERLIGRQNLTIRSTWGSEKNNPTPIIASVGGWELENLNIPQADSFSYFEVMKSTP